LHKDPNLREAAARLACVSVLLRPVRSGESYRSVAARFGVAVSSVVKWSQRFRAAGSVAPGKMKGTASGY
jgi:transposase